MGLIPILLASLLFPRSGGERPDDPEDPEKLRREAEFATDGDDDDDDEHQSRGPEPSGRIEDDSESIHDSDQQDDGEDEPEESPRPQRRVTFGNPPGESSPPSENGDARPGFLSRLKAVVFPPQDEDKPLSIPNYRTLPIMSGLIVPFSILLEIPGLTDNWYIRTDGNVVVETRPNPVLLDVGLGISMFFAAVANVSLICRFLDRGPVFVTTMITIVSLTIHGNASLRNSTPDFVLIVHRFNQHYRRFRVWCPAPVQRWFHVRPGILDDWYVYRT